MSVTDRAGDVRIARRATGLPRAQRTSIDLRRVDVEPIADAARFTVRLRTVLRTRAFDQMVFLRLVPPAGSSETWSGDIGMSAQRRDLAYANYFTDGSGTSYEVCDPLRARVRHRTDEIVLDVPLRCLPEGEVLVKVLSLTGYFRSDAARPWSQDRARFPAPIVLR
ncbi:hypothetical protein CXG46_05725 [Nocardioides alpinus]|uniref:Xaa-Pro dipeptidyl-peptidase C-terminal domain-containing protein n=1 Tax=Nocardioides alpinus TaxID=748909 RepID=A0ABX4R0N3_9ACTN|nr:hypothetical protein CXG46_05725 [Nocardioides alpinus]